MLRSFPAVIHPVNTAKINLECFIDKIQQLCKCTHPWLRSFSVLSNQRRTATALPSRHWVKISSILVPSGSLRQWNPSSPTRSVLEKGCDVPLPKLHKPIGTSVIQSKRQKRNKRSVQGSANPQTPKVFVFCMKKKRSTVRNVVFKVFGSELEQM